jgi:hypothetical protein
MTDKWPDDALDTAYDRALRELEEARQNVKMLEGRVEYIRTVMRLQAEEDAT